MEGAALRAQTATDILRALKDKAPLRLKDSI
jgi:hypothetical protein